jgi:hypothetical protein
MNLFLIIMLAATLPTYQDFQRIDRTRRQTGQMLMAEWLRVSEIDASLIQRTVQQHPDDPKIVWGAAELLADWPQRRELYQAALAATGTNAGIALRFGCAAAKQGEADLAVQWLHDCQKRDNDNTAPWVAELWLRRQLNQPALFKNAPAVWTASFRDYSVEASRARIRLLEAAGYTPYAARRLGLSAESPVLAMARDLCKPPINETTAAILGESSRALQQHPQLLLWELVGQSLERALMSWRTDAGIGEAAHGRSIAIYKRREELQALLADVERNTVDFATEAQMVQYFDNVLDKGEEAAMKELTETVHSN